MMTFMAAAGPALGQIEGSGGFQLWQSLGGLALVFGLLILSLKLLGRFNRRHNPGQTSLLTVWHLGPKREIQVLRLGDDVHYIYRHEGSMVLLKQESFADWQRFQAANPERQAENGLAKVLGGKFPLTGLVRKSPAGAGHVTAPARVGDLLQSLKS